MSSTQPEHALPMKIGRPRIGIDWEQFQKLCEMLCTLKEIAGWFRCSEATIERRCIETFGKVFSEVYRDFSAIANCSLRRKQMEVALAGDKTMLIWLGKNILGQKDVPDPPKLGDNENDVVRGLADIKRKLGAPTSPGETINVNRPREAETVTQTPKSGVNG